MKFAVLALLGVANAISLTKMEPDAQKPNQYNNVCDHLAPENKDGGCVMGVAQKPSLTQKKEPEAQKPNQYNNVCDHLAPENKDGGCVMGVAQVSKK